jgi:hypothetical protein
VQKRRDALPHRNAVSLPFAQENLYGRKRISIPTDRISDHGNGGCYGFTPYFLIPEVSPDNDFHRSLAFILLYEGLPSLLIVTRQKTFFKRKIKKLTPTRTFFIYESGSAMLVAVHGTVPPKFDIYIHFVSRSVLPSVLSPQRAFRIAAGDG